ncbi:MAG: hypothetical protein J6X72_03725 [Clostridia bacterium]|nr:hypothetical protein [Clostridia bacterium]
MKKIFTILLIITLLLTICLLGFSCKESDPIIGERFDLTNQVLDFIKETYYSDLDYDLADLYAAYGLVSSLGQYNYFNSVADLLSSDTDGKGFGLIIRNTRYNEHLIDCILEGSPFLTACDGFTPQRGDEITYIDGTRVYGVSNDLYSAFLSTLPSDRDVTFTLKRGEESFDVAYTKVDFAFPYCIYVNDLNGVPSDFGYLWLRSFTMTKDHRTEEEFRNAVKSFLHDGNRALILDLRGNGGGSSTVLATVASALIGENVAVGTPLVEVKYEKKGTSSYVLSTAAQYRVDTPIYVLCDGGTASASEALIGVMKAHGTLTALIGQPTVGKGVAQNAPNDSIEDSVGYLVDKGQDTEGNEKIVGDYFVQLIVGRYYIYDDAYEGGKYCMHGNPFIPDISVTGDNVIDPDYGRDLYIHAAVEDYNSKKTQ